MIILIKDHKAIYFLYMFRHEKIPWMIQKKIQILTFGILFDEILAYKYVCTYKIPSLYFWGSEPLINRF